jgi:KaiC domain protein
VVAVSDDDDWFERAFRDDDADDSPDDGTDEAPERTQPSEPPEEDGTTADELESEESEPSGQGSGTPRESTAEADTQAGADDPHPDAGEDADGDAAHAGTDDGPPVDGTDADGDNPFGQDFGAALENAPEPDVGPEQPNPGGGTDPFGGGAGDGGGGSPFGDDEEAPLESGEGGDFGFGGGGGADPESFDEAEFESDLERLDIGIEGLDEMILGGVPRRSLMVAIGSAGTGKTTFGLQFLHHGLEHGEDAVYITLEESYDRIVSTADEKGWGFESYVDDGRLAVVDIDPIEMSNSLDSIQNDLPNLIEDFGADRLVLDSVSLLEMMYESAPRRRSQVFGFARSLKEAGITILLTSEADRDHAYASRFGIVEYLADAVFVLQYVRPSDFRETRLAVEIQKIRDANHSRETKPYDLTAEGISVYRQANIF